MYSRIIKLGRTSENDINVFDIRKEIQINNEEMYFLYIYFNLFLEDKKELKYNIVISEGIL